jgi:hypothetical protein
LVFTAKGDSGHPGWRLADLVVRMDGITVASINDVAMGMNSMLVNSIGSASGPHEVGLMGPALGRITLP